MRRPLVLAAAALVALAVAFAFRLGGRSRAAAEVERLPVAAAGERIAPAPPVIADGVVRNAVLLLGDGLGLSQLSTARIHLHGPTGRLALERLPVLGLMTVHPAGGLVPKSDAAATALASGFATTNGRIGSDPAGRPLGSFAKAFHERGGAVGLVTTSRVTDATPAAFAAHVERRGDQAAIAEQLLEARFDLLLGGGRAWFAPVAAGGARADGRDLRAEARAAGYQVVETLADLDAAGPGPLLGLFAADQLPLSSAEPTLDQMARVALTRLTATGRPFFLLLEEEGLDTAAHQRDLEALAAALARFDAAVEVATEFAAADGATLVVVVGDHGTGALRIDARSTERELVAVWTSDAHLADPVPLFAYGPGSKAFSGLHDNRDVGRELARALGVELAAGAR